MYSKCLRIKFLNMYQIFVPLQLHLAGIMQQIVIASLISRLSSLALPFFASHEKPCFLFLNKATIFLN